MGLFLGAGGVFGLGAGDSGLLRAGAWCRTPHGALVARSCRAARSARGPRGRGAARPYPPDPYLRQAELAGFCALARACCASRRVFCAGACSDPYVCAGAWCCTPHGALVARSCRAARSARGPRGRGAARPYPRTPTRGKLSLQAFARFRARAALRAGVSVLAHGATRMFVLAHAATRPLALTPLVRTTLVCFSAAACLAPRIAARLPH